MKKAMFMVLGFLPLTLLSQLTTNSFVHNSISRDYLTYQPAVYTGNSAVPLVIALHGLGDNMNNFTNISMNLIADTANFIVVTPQAILETQITNSTAWNSGAQAFGFTLNPTIDDIGFLNELIDTISANYNIDSQRIYFCGFSMGGFMSQRLACESNTQIAAIASVAGTIGGAINCSPGRAVPVCHFHGTADGTVAYSGNQYGNDAEDLVEFWALNNSCGSSPTVTILPDLANDGYTVTHSLYDGCTDNADVEFYSVDAAGHEWLSPPPTNDIFYTAEIWKFFQKHSLSLNPVDVTELETCKGLEIFPNPSSGNIQLKTQNGDTKILVYSVSGQLIFEDQVAEKQQTLDLTHLPNGSYYLNVINRGETIVEKLQIIH